MDAATEDLERRTRALLEPGDIDLQGLIVDTDLEDDVDMMETTLEVANVIATAAGHDPGDVYVHSGNDDPEFASNLHQGLTIAEDEFVWECQQLRREGTFDVVFYYEAAADQDHILGTLRERGFDVTDVQPAA
jgi:hypothetical protein